MSIMISPHSFYAKNENGERVPVCVSASDRAEIDEIKENITLLLVATGS